MRLITCLLIAGTLVASGSTVADELWIPAVARGAGLAGSLWRSELVLRNPGAAPIEVELSFLARNTDNRGQTPRRVELESGELRRFDDLLAELFELESAGGAVAISSTASFEAEAAIINEGSGARFGQGFRALGASQALDAVGRAEGRILGLREDAETRSNLYALNLDETASVVELTILDETGASFEVERSLPPLAALLESLAELAPAASGELVVDLRVGAGRILVGGSSIDRSSGDPLTHELLEAPTNAAGRWVGRVGEPFVDVLGGIELELDESERLRSVDLSYGASAPGCDLRFPLGRDDLAASLDELAAGLESVNGFSCFGCGDISWTLEVEFAGDRGQGTISAVASDFFGDFAGCDGALGELEIELGRRP